MRGFKVTNFFLKPRIPKVQEFYENISEKPFPTVAIVEMKPKCLGFLTGLQQTSLSDAMTQTKTNPSV